MWWRANDKKTSISFYLVLSCTLRIEIAELLINYWDCISFWVFVFFQIVEPFTAHYVFALGVARFLSCAHWVLQVLDTRGGLLTALGYGMWPSMVLLSEIVQTFILADFCYYYVKSVFGGQLVLRLPSGVVWTMLNYTGRIGDHLRLLPSGDGSYSCLVPFSPPPVRPL